MHATELLAEIRNRGIQEEVRDTYAWGQSYISTEEDPDGTKGHQAGVEAVWDLLVKRSIKFDCQHEIEEALSIGDLT